MSGIGTKIKALRESNDMSQDDLAKRIGKTRSAVSQYESGKIIPRMGVIEDIAAVFGVNKLELLGDRVPGYSYTIVSLDESEPSEQSDEARLLGAFRRLDAESRALLLDMARRLAR